MASPGRNEKNKPIWAAGEAGGGDREARTPLTSKIFYEVWALFEMLFCSGADPALSGRQAAED